MNEEDMKKYLEKTLKEANSHQLKLPLLNLKPGFLSKNPSEKSSPPFTRADFLTRKSLFIRENKD